MSTTLKIKNRGDRKMKKANGAGLAHGSLFCLKYFCLPGILDFPAPDVSAGAGLLF